MHAIAGKVISNPTIAGVIDRVCAHPDCLIAWALVVLYALAVVFLNRHRVLRLVYFGIMTAHLAAAMLAVGGM